MNLQVAAPSPNCATPLASRPFPVVSLVNAVLSMPVAAMWISAPLTLATATEDRRYAWMWAFGIVAIVVFAWLSFVGWRRGWNGGLAFLLGMPAFFLNLLTLFAVLLVALGFEIT